VRTIRPRVSLSTSSPARFGLNADVLFSPVFQRPLSISPALYAALFRFFQGDIIARPCVSSRCRRVQRAVTCGAVSVLLFIGMPSVHSRQIKKCKVNDFLKKVNLKVVYIKKKL